MNLIPVFRSLKIPQILEGESFESEILTGYPNFRIGVNAQGLPALLLNIGEGLGKPLGRNLKLKHLLVQHNLRCKIIERGNSKYESLTAIKFISTEPTLQDIFLRMAGNLILSLGELASSADLIHQINKFAELFRAMSDTPKKTVQGLWGELLLIERASNTRNLIDYWHNDPQEKFDFNAFSEKVEVKTSTDFSRNHFFSAEQLEDKNHVMIVIASILLRQTGSGLNVFELAQLISLKVENDLEIMEKVNLTIFHTLGSSLEYAMDIKYDYALGCESMSFFNQKDISRINLNELPKEISNIKYQSDLSNVPCISRESIAKYDKLIKSCL